MKKEIIIVKITYRSRTKEERQKAVTKALQKYIAAELKKTG